MGWEWSCLTQVALYTLHTRKGGAIGTESIRRSGKCCTNLEVPCGSSANAVTLQIYLCAF